MPIRSTSPAGCQVALPPTSDAADRPSLTERMRRRHEAWLAQRQSFARQVGVPLERLPSMIFPPRCVAAGPLTESLERDGVLSDLALLQQFAQLEERSPDEARRVDARLRSGQCKMPSLAIAAALVR